MNFCPECQRSNTSDAAFCSACGARMERFATDEAFVAESLPFPVGAEVAFGRYTLEAVLGQGGMGTVYRARDESLGRRCALKVLNADLLAHPTARKRMEREARALARIDHRNVVRVSNIFLEGDLLVMELEYMEGGDLQGQVGPNGMAHERVVPLMAGILGGLQALHDAQLVHRDIKPENVLLTGAGVPKLTDLGVARDDADTTRTRTRLGAVLGTLEYMSPEQIQGSPVDARSDIYACGNLLYHLLTGGLPYSATSDFEWQVAHVQQPPDLAGLRRNAPQLAQVVERALEKSPDARWQSAADMATALRDTTKVENAAGKQPADRFATATEIANALPVIDSLQSVERTQHQLLATEAQQQEDRFLQKSSEHDELVYKPLPEGPTSLGAHFVFCVTEGYASFSGRASRKQYIAFSMASFLLVFCVVVAGEMMGAGGSGSAVLMLTMLGLILPSWAVSVRRLHDINVTGWAILVLLVPYLNFLFVLVLAVIPSSSGANRFGSLPS